MNGSLSVFATTGFVGFSIVGFVITDTKGATASTTDAIGGHITAFACIAGASTSDDVITTVRVHATADGTACSLLMSSLLLDEIIWIGWIHKGSICKGDDSGFVAADMNHILDGIGIHGPDLAIVITMVVVGRQNISFITHPTLTSMARHSIQ